MPCTDRRRIDYQPGQAALDALDVAEGLRPDLRQQELIDWLLIVGVSAVTHQHWSPPQLLGDRRDGWKLPSGVRASR